MNRLASKRWQLVPVLLASIILFACERPQGGTDHGQPTPEELFSSLITDVELEVDYENGAEPYTGSVGLSSDVWNLFRVNAERVFEGTGATVSVPGDLDEMESLGSLSGDEYRVEDILQIASAHRDRTSADGTANYYILWLDGHFHDGAELRDTVLGVSLGDTGIIAMFKPVIETTHLELFPSVSAFVEQTTLVHEFGHAVGLVDNGLPLSTDHRDSDHDAHCAHQDCVMYWANEGASDLSDFVRAYVASGSAIVFGSDCLADIDAQSEAGE